MDKRAYLGKILVIIFVIVVFVILVVLGIVKERSDILLPVVFYSIAVFLIANSVRYLKYGKWYIDPRSYGWGWPWNETIRLYHAVASLIFGIIVLILVFLWIVEDFL